MLLGTIPISVPDGHAVVGGACATSARVELVEKRIATPMKTRSMSAITSRRGVASALVCVLLECVSPRSVAARSLEPSGRRGIVRCAMWTARPRQAFLRDPVGGYVFGERWLYFAATERVFGCVFWDEPTAEDLEDYVRVMIDEERARAPHVTLVDALEVSGISARAFAVIAAYAATHRDALARVVTEIAVVRPQGIAGAVVGGFFAVVPKPFPVSMFAAREEALGRLGCRDAASIAVEISATTAALRGVAPFLQAVRVALFATILDPTLEATARSLGVSERTLQRRLAEHETTFAREVLDLRVDAAKKLLRQPDISVTDVALMIGFSSSQHFGTAFKRATGMTPLDYRKTAR